MLSVSQSILIFCALILSALSHVHFTN